MESADKSGSPLRTIKHNKPLRRLMRPVQLMMEERKQSIKTMRALEEAQRNREFKLQNKAYSVGALINEMRSNI